jgi:hypothetical protein
MKLFKRKAFYFAILLGEFSAMIRFQQRRKKNSKKVLEVETFTRNVRKFVNIFYGFQIAF